GPAIPLKSGASTSWCECLPAAREEIPTSCTPSTPSPRSLPPGRCDACALLFALLVRFLPAERWECESSAEFLVLAKSGQAAWVEVCSSSFRLTIVIVYANVYNVRIHYKAPSLLAREWRKKWRESALSLPAPLLALRGRPP